MFFILDGLTKAVVHDILPVLPQLGALEENTMKAAERLNVLRTQVFAGRNPLLEELCCQQLAPCARIGDQGFSLLDAVLVEHNDGEIRRALGSMGVDIERVQAMSLHNVAPELAEATNADGVYGRLRATMRAFGPFGELFNARFPNQAHNPVVERLLIDPLRQQVANLFATSPWARRDVHNGDFGALASLVIDHFTKLTQAMVNATINGRYDDLAVLGPVLANAYNAIPLGEIAIDGESRYLVLSA